MLKILLLAILYGFFTPAEGHQMEASFCPCNMEKDFKQELGKHLPELIPGGTLPNIGGLLSALTNIVVINIDIDTLKLHCKENYGISLDLHLLILLKALGIPKINVDARIAADFLLSESGNITLQLLDSVNPDIDVKVTGLGLLSSLLNSLVEVLLKILTGTVRPVLNLVLVAINNLLTALTAVLVLGDAGSMQCSIKNVTVTDSEIVVILEPEIKDAHDNPVPVPKIPVPALPPPLPKNNFSLAVSDPVINTALSLPKYKTSKIDFGITKADFIHLLPEFDQFIIDGVGLEAEISISAAPELKSLASGFSMVVHIDISILSKGSHAALLELSSNIALHADVTIEGGHLCISFSLPSDLNLHLQYKRSSIQCGCEKVPALQTYLVKVLSLSLPAQLEAALCIVPMPKIPAPPEIIQGTKCVPQEGYFTAQR